MKTVPFPSAYAGPALVAVTLLASINVAVLIVPLTDQAPQPRLGFLPGTPDQIAVLSGTIATIWLLAAVRMLLQVSTDERADPWYGRAGICWSNGIGTFMLTIGLLAHSKIPVELPVIATATAILVIVDMCRDRTYGQNWWWAATLTALDALGCLAVALASFT